MSTTVTYVSASVCSQCYRVGLSVWMSSAYPCPDCGAEVLDYFSVGTTRVAGFRAWWNSTIRMDISTLRHTLERWSKDAAHVAALDGAKRRYAPNTQPR